MEEKIRIRKKNCTVLRKTTLWSQYVHGFITFWKTHFLKIYDLGNNKFRTCIGSLSGEVGIFDLLAPKSETKELSNPIDTDSQPNESPNSDDESNQPSPDPESPTTGQINPSKQEATKELPKPNENLNFSGLTSEQERLIHEKLTAGKWQECV